MMKFVDVLPLCELACKFESKTKHHNGRREFPGGCGRCGYSLALRHEPCQVPCVLFVFLSVGLEGELYERGWMHASVDV